MILAASIVGSGELIATTTLGAEVGYALLWLIILSCVVKPAVQSEIGRYVIATGETVPHQYAGRVIPNSFVHATNPADKEWQHEQEFDGELYLAANPDVAAAGVNPAEHYLKFGRKERRRLRP